MKIVCRTKNINYGLYLLIDTEEGVKVFAKYFSPQFKLRKKFSNIEYFMHTEYTEYRQMNKLKTLPLDLNRQQLREILNLDNDIRIEYFYKLP